MSRNLCRLLLAGALICVAVPLWADSNVRIVRLSYLDGDVQIDRGAGQGLERAVLNMPVVQGTRLSTQSGATAEVEFEDGSTLRLIPATTVEFRTLVLRDSGERVSAMELAQGTAYLAAANKKDVFSIAAGGHGFTLVHAARLRLRRHDPDLSLSVFKGEAEVQNANGSLRVKKDETLNLDLNDLAEYQLLKGIEPDGYDRWSQQRDQYRQTYAASHRGGYNSLYSYGWSDLNYYGSFTQFGSMGMFWRPAGVPLGWDPFGDGAWMYYPGNGYMWVSGYPWGWMPYRYGSWMFVPGFGWGWRPGPVWTTWYASPGIYGAPAGYVGPAPPVVTKPAPTTVARTVVVGAGPITDVRNPRFRQWVTQTRSASMRMRTAGVAPGPVASPATRAPVTRGSGISSSHASGASGMSRSSGSHSGGSGGGGHSSGGGSSRSSSSGSHR